MATTNFSSSILLNCRYGIFDDTTNVARSAGISRNNGYRFLVTGTDATILLNGNGSQPFNISVDGGNFTNPTVSGGQITLFSGLTDGIHTVDMIAGTSYNGGNSWITVSASCLTITGSAPNVTPDPNFGSEMQLYRQSGLKWIENLLMYFGPVGNAGNGTYAYNYYAVGCDSFRFQATVQAGYGIYVFTQKLALYKVEIDGVPSATFTVPNVTFDMRWVQIAVGDGKLHEYKFVAAGRVDNVFSFRIDGQQSTYNTKDLLNQPYILALGDSITNGSPCAADNDLTHSWSYKLAVNLKGSASTRGILGASTQQFLDTYLVKYVTTVARQPNAIVVFLGYNDTVSTTLIPYTTILNYLISNTTAPIVATLIPNHNGLAAYDAINVQITNAVAACSKPSRITIADLHSLIYEDCDTIHPTDLGSQVLAFGFRPFVISTLVSSSVTTVVPQHLSPKLTFQVNLYDLQNITSFEPDSRSNILSQLNSASIQIPSVPGDEYGNLYQGNVFISYGQQALEIKKVYGRYLTVLSTEY